MFDVKTPLRILHRPVRKVAVSGMIAVPGQWGWIDNNGAINQIVDTPLTSKQPQVLKPIYNKIGSSYYETQETRAGGRIATVEGRFRAKVDSNGYQVYDCEAVPVKITYTNGMALTVAYRVAASATSNLEYSAAADLGKLRPAQSGEVVVAEVEGGVDTSGNLHFITVSPYDQFGDSILLYAGQGSIKMPQITGSGSGQHS